MKVYIVMREAAAYLGSPRGVMDVFLSKEAAEKEYGERLGDNYWLEEHEVIEE